MPAHRSTSGGQATSISICSNDHFKGVVGTTPIDLTTTSFVFMATQQFKVNKTLTAELNGRYRNGWLEGVIRVRPLGFVGAGVSQQILKNKGMIRLTARDIFFTQKVKGSSTVRQC